MSNSTELATVRPDEQLDWASLEAKLRDAIVDLPEAPMGVLQFPRGTANLTYLLEFGDRRLVLRRPPFGTIAPGAHDMAREHSVLSRLWRAYPRAPRAFVYSDDISVIGAPFVVQEYRDEGVVIFDAAPDTMSNAPNLGARLTKALADALADLHSVDFVTAGLSDIGRPDGFVERQMTGWRERWRRVASQASSATMDRAADALQAALPASTLKAVVHNDFKLNNCQFKPDDPDTVISVFDWDMATLGDPLIDVGIVLDYWGSMQDTPGIDLPAKDHFARHYATRMGLDPAAFTWYEAFACWRKGVVVQQIFSRYASGETRDDRFKDYGSLASGCGERALAALSGA